MFDRATGRFLSTPARRALLTDGPVLYEGIAPALLGPSLAKTPNWRRASEETVRRQGLNLARAWQQCDKSERSEGLYVKVETDYTTTVRLKWVHHDFVQAILDSARHHSEQPFIPNQLAPGVDIYAPRPTVTWRSRLASRPGK